MFIIAYIFYLSSLSFNVILLVLKMCIIFYNVLKITELWELESLGKGLARAKA